MNSLRNKVHLIGRLGSAPEVKTFDNGKKMAQFSLATNESYRNDQGEKITDTQWHHIVLWGKSAELAEQFLAKGSEVALEGRLTYRDYVDKEGNKRSATDVVGYEFLMLDHNKKTQAKEA
jgi:single-strand DNA-binding protein